MKPVLLAVPIGALGGCVAGLAGSLARETLEVGALADLAEIVQVQAVMLGVFGAGVGLALGLLGRSGRTVFAAGFAGMLAGMLAGVLYPFAVSLILPTASTDFLIPAGAWDRLLWVALSAGLLGLIVPGMALPRTHRSISSARLRVEGTQER
jgi:hypothetical protein